MGGFEAAFYERSTLAELEKRVQWADRCNAATAAAPSPAGGEQGRAMVDPDQAFDSSCSICLEPLLAPPTCPAAATTRAACGKPRVAVALPLCLHAFHEECIYGWLQDHRSCPNCRADLQRTASV